MESSVSPAAHYPPPLAVFAAWVFDPTTDLRVRGVATSDLYIYPQAVACEPRKVARRLVGLPRVVYQWRVAVVQRIVWSYRLNLPGMTSLLVDIDGRLGSVVVRDGKRLAPTLEQAGFEVIHDTVRGWERPQPLGIRDHPDMVGRLPLPMLVEHSRRRAEPPVIG